MGYRNWAADIFLRVFAETQVRAACVLPAPYNIVDTIAQPASTEQVIAPLLIILPVAKQRAVTSDLLPPGNSVRCVLRVMGSPRAVWGFIPVGNERVQRIPMKKLWAGLELLSGGSIVI